MPTPSRSFRAAPIVDQTCARNGGGRGLSHRLAQIADRYALLLDRSGGVALTQAEINLLRAACAHTAHEPAELVPGSLAAIVEDSLPDGLAQKWGVDGAGLVQRLAALTVAQEVALIEDIEGWWARQPPAA